MTYLRNSILATLAYYDILDFPLTLLEVNRYLINPGRLMWISNGIGEINLFYIKKSLDRLVSSDLIGEKNGFYFLFGRVNLPYSI